MGVKIINMRKRERIIMNFRYCGIFMVLLFTRYNMAILPNFKGISLEEYNQLNNALGYDNCDIEKNGELMVIKHLIPICKIIFDAGANIGEWSTHALELNNEAIVYAFEPVQSMFAILIENICTKRPNTHAYQIGLSYFDGKKDFYDYTKNNEISGASTCYRRDTAIEKMLGKAPTKITINVRSLDSFCHDQGIFHIDFLKIDTEGSEFDILKGASELLQRHAIKIIQFEYGGTYPSANIKLHDVYTFLRNFGYQVFHILPNKLIHISDWTNTLENYRYSKFLAISSDFLN